MIDSPSVLVCDDEPGIRALESRWIEVAGHRCRTAASSAEALQLMEREPADLALLDIRMPGMSGLALARTLRERYPETAIVMATGVADITAAVEAMQVGAVDYVLKPFQKDDLIQAVERGLARHEEQRAASRRARQLEVEIRERSADLTQLLIDLEIGSSGSVNALLAAVHARDGSTAEHARRVAQLAVSLGLASGITEPALTSLERAALLHDVGKIAIPSAVLNKPGSLDSDEVALVRRHPQIGYDIVRNVPFFAEAAEIILAHQERFDGTGYPRGLAGEAIPLGARVLAVADTFDALTHTRSYREAVVPRAALIEISRCAGTQFDPNVVDALLNVAPME